MDAIIIKKVISYCINPFTMSIILLAVSLFLVASRAKTKIVLLFFIFGFALLVCQSLPLVPNLILGQAVSRYAPLSGDVDLPHDVRWVVVLSGAAVDDPSLPVTSQNPGDTTHRVVEGVVLAWKLPDSKLLLSGGDVYGDGAAAEVMERLALALHFPQERIVKEGVSRDTEDQARLIASIVGNDSFVLVTSLRHMPRSMGLFKGYGMDPVAAPVAYPSTRYGSSLASLLPTASAAAVSASIAHELQGSMWFALKQAVSAR